MCASLYKTGMAEGGGGGESSLPPIILNQKYLKIDIAKNRLNLSSIYHQFSRGILLVRKKI